MDHSEGKTVSNEPDVTFDVELDDGRIAHCWQALSQPYADAKFSAGLVTNIDPDVLYLRLERNGDEPLSLFLRRDELQALVWVASGALWALEMQEKDGSETLVGVGESQARLDKPKEM